MENKRTRGKCIKCDRSADVKERGTLLCAACHIEKSRAREIKNEFNNLRL